MSIDEIEECFAEAQQVRLDRAMVALAPKHQGGEWDKYFAASEAVLKLERELAAAKGDEHADP